MESAWGRQIRAQPSISPSSIAPVASLLDTAPTRAGCGHGGPLSIRVMKYDVRYGYAILFTPNIHSLIESVGRPLDGNLKDANSIDCNHRGLIVRLYNN